MSLESDLRVLVDYRALLELKYRYCWCVDADDIEGFANVFSEDAVLTARRFGEEEPYLRREGREELRGLIRKRQETLNRSLGQHRPYNPLITINGDAAEGKWYMTAIAKEGDGTFEFEFGEYHEKYRRVDDDWKIARCAVEYLEMEPELAE